MPWPLFVHLMSLGCWFGCVLVEAVIELRAYRDSHFRPLIARLHRDIDLCVEIPCLAGVLASGLWMFDLDALRGLLVVKIGAGLFAITVNVWCIVHVLRRASCARKGDVSGIDRGSRKVHLAFVIGAPAGLTALGIGISRLLGS